ncbi:MAG: trifunctional transcriptional activator/DNA repair protein Ada/methylated-DNA--[protein]-cysteine S-methyltransferase [Pseudomonadota bacterium]
MLFQLPSDDVLYTALVERDPSYEGLAFVGVKSTGVFCRLICPARNPRRENVAFYDTVAACLESGFRPCKRCKPMDPIGEPDPAVKKLLEAVDQQPERRWYEADIVRMGYDPSTIRRRFKRRFGLSFLEIARLRRVGSAAEKLASGGRVIDAQLDAGFDSGSGFRAAITKLLGQAPAKLRGRDILRADWIETPIGQMLGIADPHALHLLEFVDRPALPKEIKRLQKRSGAAISIGRYDPIDGIEAELRVYFDGNPDGFKTRLAKFGTDFQERVWHLLRTIPLGETRSYSGLAESMDKPSATRAVARANGANQIAIVIPCHRVIGANGDLTGYGGGLWRKRWLLQHEHRMIENQR